MTSDDTTNKGLPYPNSYVRHSTLITYAIQGIILTIGGYWYQFVIIDLMPAGVLMMIISSFFLWISWITIIDKIDLKNKRKFLKENDLYELNKTCKNCSLKRDYFVSKGICEIEVLKNKKCERCGCSII